MKIHGLVLAAGLSSRMGVFKPLLDIKGQPMVYQTVMTMAEFCDRVYLVVGHNKHQVMALFKGQKHIQIIENDTYKDGMFSSVKLGCQAFTGECLFVMPADMPFVKPSTFKSLLNQEGLVKIPSFNHKAGHPILLDQAVVRAVAKSNEVTLRQALADWPKTYVDVEDEGILVDLDTPQAYAHHVKETHHEDF